MAIDEERVTAGISQYALCQQANVHPTTYQRLLKKPEGGQRRTIGRLARALEEIKARRAPIQGAA